MPVAGHFHRSWQVRPTLRLMTPFPDPPFAESTRRWLDAILEALRSSPGVAAANVWTQQGPQSYGIEATIVLPGPSSPGAAVDEAVSLLNEACAAAGVDVDVIKEIVVTMGGVDPRSL
jgi:hypothetical protein